MTREEARLRMLAGTESRYSDDVIDDFLDLLEKLDVVKHVDPTAPWERFLAGMREEGYDPDRNIVIVDIRMVMERAGIAMADRGRPNEQGGYTLPLKPGI